MSESVVELTDLTYVHVYFSPQVRELQDQLQANSDAADEWKAKYDDLEYKLQQATSQVAILDHRLRTAQIENKNLSEELAVFKGTSTGSPKGAFIRASQMRIESKREALISEVVVVN